MNRKIIALLMALAMIAALAAGCGGGGAANTTAAATTTAKAAETTTAKAAETTTAKAAETTTAKAAETTKAAATTAAATTAAAASTPDLPFVELTIYMMGEPGKDLDQFYEIFDEWTRRDFNCTVRFKHANTWIDYKAKYNLMLTADDTIDMCYAANWVDFYAYAKKDAFEDITDMLPKYCPQIWAGYPNERFKGASVNGKIYGVPQNWTNYHGENFVWREDLRKKYGLPEMALEWDVMENYIKTVLENEDIPFAVTYQYTNPSSLYRTIELSKTYSGIDGTAIAMMSERGTKNTILYYEQPSYRDFAQRMKNWCDMGFWSKSILATADSTDHTDLFAEGLIFVVTNSHVDRFNGIPEKIIKDGLPYEVGFIPHATVSGVFYHTRTAQDLTVVPNGAKNPERALMVLDKLIMDKDYYDLTQYGILGLNYELEDGYYSTKNIDTTTHGFGLSLWAMRNQDLAYPVTRFWDRKANYEDIYFPKLVFDPFDGFAIDLKDVQAEFTACNQVMTEYGAPIEWGIVPDPSAAVDTLIQKMNEAGIQKFKAEIDRQISDYFDSRK